jgi:hypothetical protein
MYLREKYRRRENAYPRTAELTSGLRSYSPTLGRWVSRDPSAVTGFLTHIPQARLRSNEVRAKESIVTALQAYGFVQNQPIRLIDRIGLMGVLPIRRGPVVGVLVCWWRGTPTVRWLDPAWQVTKVTYHGATRYIECWAERTAVASGTHCCAGGVWICGIIPYWKCVKTTNFRYQKQQYLYAFVNPNPDGSAPDPQTYCANWAAGLGGNPSPPTM